MVNTLAASIRNYKWPTIATPILVLFEVACEMAIPFVTANLIDVIKERNGRRDPAHGRGPRRHRSHIAAVRCRCGHYL